MDEIRHSQGTEGQEWSACENCFGVVEDGSAYTQNVNI
jgi:hypothetical protein